MSSRVQGLVLSKIYAANFLAGVGGIPLLYRVGKELPYTMSDRPRGGPALPSVLITSALQREESF